VAERQTLFDAIFISRVDSSGSSQPAPAFGIFGLQQMPLACSRAQNFSTGGNLEPLGGGFLGLYTFGPSHK
jgi:hypothetical protein